MSMRAEAQVTALSWIPSDAISGLMRAPFDAGITHCDAPPPDHLGDTGSSLEDLRAADRFRFANVLRAWIDVDAQGVIAGCGYAGGAILGSTTVHVPGVVHRFEAFALPDLQSEPELVEGGTAVRFQQTCGGRTGLPAPRRVRRKPYVQWQAPLVWSTLELTLRSDGTSSYSLLGASRFPRHWIYDQTGARAAKSGLTAFKDWYRKSFGRHSPWGDQDSPALVTAVESALERSLSAHLMGGGNKPKILRVKAGATLVTEGDPGDGMFLLLDGVLRAEKQGERLAEYGPGALLGEHASLQQGPRTATLVAVTACRVAVVRAEDLDRGARETLAEGHRNEEVPPARQP